MNALPGKSCRFAVLHDYSSDGSFMCGALWITYHRHRVGESVPATTTVKIWPTDSSSRSGQMPIERKTKIQWLTLAKHCTWVGGVGLEQLHVCSHSLDYMLLPWSIVFHTACGHIAWIGLDELHSEAQICYGQQILYMHILYPPPYPTNNFVLKKYGPNGSVRWTRHSLDTGGGGVLQSLSTNHKQTRGIFPSQ